MGAFDHIIRPEWFGAVPDGVIDCTAALQTAVGLAETVDSGIGVVQLTGGIYKFGGVNITKAVTIQGNKWKTILRNTSAVNHSIARAGGADVATRGITIKDLALEFTGGGSAVDGIYMQQCNNHLTLHSIYCLEAPRNGLYIEGDEESFTGNLYANLSQIYSEGCGNAAIYFNGGCNNATLVGGRLGSSAFGIKVDDNITGDPDSFPNTLRVFSIDLAGNDVGLHEAGHSNYYEGLRFEGNTTDIAFQTKSESAVFFGPAWSSTPVITGSPNARATFYSKDFSIRQFEPNGYLEYWDETAAVGGALRLAPKRSVYNVIIPATLAGSGTVTFPIAGSRDRQKLKRVSIIPETGITGANTNNMRLALRNIKSGSDVLCAATTFSSGVNAAALTDTALTITAGNDIQVSGDVAYFQKTENGTGMASPALALQTEYGGY